MKYQVQRVEKLSESPSFFIFSFLAVAILLDFHFQSSQSLFRAIGTGGRRGNYPSRFCSKYKENLSFKTLLINTYSQILARIGSRPFHSKVLGFVISPSDFQTFRRSCQIRLPLQDGLCRYSKPTLCSCSMYGTDQQNRNTTKISLLILQKCLQPDLVLALIWPQVCCEMVNFGQNDRKYLN